MPVTPRQCQAHWHIAKGSLIMEEIADGIMKIEILRYPLPVD